jgi:ankyrin repeat protein
VSYITGVYSRFCYAFLYVLSLQEEGWTALTVAATTGNAEIVQLILDRGADVKARNTVSVDKRCSRTHL